MERYIFIRDYQKVKKKSLLISEEKGYRAYGPDGKKMVPKIKEITHHLRIHLLALDADLLKTAFNSFAYMNWIKERISYQDENGNPLFAGLTKTPETLIIYLMELGVPADTLMRYIYGPENKYLEYRYLVQEFGKIV